MEFEQLYQELARGAEVVQALVAGMPPGEARFRPAPDVWSVLEVICHLYDEEREDFRQRLDIILHRPDQPWPPIDPAGWVTARNYQARDLAEMLDSFLAERTQSLIWLRGLSTPNWDAVYTARFGPITAGDMFAAWVAHDALHLRQLVELKWAKVVSLATPYKVQYAGDW
ncbi:MAG: DinB family protein [Anaerolineae bacterium]|nr:DinB family protein [Anaerolineae bacterium]